MTDILFVLKYDRDFNLVANKIHLFGMTSVIEREINSKFENLKTQGSFPELAELITYATKVNFGASNKRIFGYIPELFREIAIHKDVGELSPEEIFLDEPVIYKIYFGGSRTIVDIPYFYIFCYLKRSSPQLNVYFQSANHKSKLLDREDYVLSSKKVFFEGMMSAFEQDVSTICISDPGHFILNQHSSYYVGSPEINFTQLVALVIEKICDLAKIELRETFLCGTSAGGVGALLTSTYFSSKVHAMSINSQIDTYTIPETMEVFLGTKDRDVLLEKYSDRVSCRQRFQQNIKSVPNIYLLANINDGIYGINYELYQLYQKLFVSHGKNNQSLFDSYYGEEGHNQPAKNILKTKIKFARENLMLELNPQARIRNKKMHQKKAEVEYQIGVSLEEKGDINRALQHYKKAAAILPEYKSIIKLIRINQDRERYLEAEKYCRNFIKDNPKHAYMNVCLARVLKQQEQFQNAIVSYYKAIELKAELSGKIYQELGDLLLTNKKDAIAAANIYQQGLKYTKEWQPNWKYYFNLAVALTKIGRYKEAITYCQTALELERNQPKTIVTLLEKIKVKQASDR